MLYHHDLSPTKLRAGMRPFIDGAIPQADASSTSTGRPR
jgi:hypothetical protein